MKCDECEAEVEWITPKMEHPRLCDPCGYAYFENDRDIANGMGGYILPESCDDPHCEVCDNEYCQESDCEICEKKGMKWITYDDGSGCWRDKVLPMEESK